MVKISFTTRTVKIFILILVLLLGLMITITVLSASASINSPPLEWHLENPLGPQTSYFGRHISDGFGSGLSTGDINGDGFEDLVIGARFGPSSTYGAGEVYVLLGPRDFEHRYRMPDGAALILQGLPGRDYQLGTYLDTGDVNGDGYDDILTGGGISSTTILYMGSPLITSSTPQTVTTYPDEVAVSFHYEASSEDQITCDINGDGYADMILETYNKVWGVLGHPGITMTTPITIELGVDQVDFEIVGFQSTRGSFPGGGNLGCGDFDGDGISDLIVGSEYESPGGRVDAGAVFIFRGTSAITFTHPITLQAYTDADAIIEGLDGPFMVTLGDNLGARIEVADINADGKQDLILGAPGGDGINNWYPDSGEVYLLLGRELNGQSIDLAAEAQWVAYVLDDRSTYLGYSIGAGDFDRDGRDEVILGCPLCNSLSALPWTSGTTYIFDADQLQGSFFLDQAASLAIYPNPADQNFGWNVGAIDLDADGFDDPAIGKSVYWDGPNIIMFLSYPIRYQTYFPWMVK